MKRAAQIFASAVFAGMLAATALTAPAAAATRVDGMKAHVATLAISADKPTGTVQLGHTQATITGRAGINTFCTLSVGAPRKVPGIGGANVVETSAIFCDSPVTYAAICVGTAFDGIVIEGSINCGDDFGTMSLFVETFGVACATGVTYQGGASGYVQFRDGFPPDASADAVGQTGSFADCNV
ncbi:hypothetical protein Rhe02_46020 [Rhizocola hellebori]|uniref:Secreted protein n=1 Tax=Rhizocola hellebori TaxID=1392758 RepID=A0A8J3VHI2_9ACTN|nr:hypothetical protein [Rhizocola hellebori]GIH06535.1 hypothetical protein Rhe02_46020 [Rhizocola hellebori]